MNVAPTHGSPFPSDQIRVGRAEVDTLALAHLPFSCYRSTPPLDRSNHLTGGLMPSERLPARTPPRGAEAGATATLCRPPQGSLGATRAAS